MGTAENLGLSGSRLVCWVTSSTRDRGVYKQWVGMGAGQGCTREGKESRLLIYYLWALKCVTTKHR